MTVEALKMESVIESQAREIRHELIEWELTRLAAFFFFLPHTFLSLPSFPVFSSPLLSSSGYKVQAGLKARVFIPQLLTSRITGTYHYISTFLSKY